jgi:general stress protein YciG
MTDQQKPRGKQGFASMDPKRVREIASLAGRATKPENRNFARNPQAASEAGRKGGLAAGRRRKMAKEIVDA